MTRYAALLRSINAGKKLAMADLRAFLAEQGLADVQTLLASGNAVFTSGEAGERLEQRLQHAARDALGLDTDWFLRSHAELAAVIDANPFPTETEARPNHVQVLFHRAPVAADKLHMLAARYDGPERIHAHGRELYVDYPDGIGRSKLHPALAQLKLPPSTGRNWNTVTKLAALTA